MLFIAFCFEYCKFKKSLNNDRSFYFSDFPIQLDATCNGFQHVGAMIQDIKISKCVNLFVDDNEEDKVLDVYNILLKKINEDIRKFGFNNDIYKHFIYLRLKEKMLNLI